MNASLPARGQYNAAGEISRKFMRLNVRKRTFAYERPVYERPVKIQIRLRIRAVWSESLLDAFWIAKDAKFLHAVYGDSDQTLQMRSLIWVFV